MKRNDEGQHDTSQLAKSAFIYPVAYECDGVSN